MNNRRSLVCFVLLCSFCLSSCHGRSQQEPGARLHHVVLCWLKDAGNQEQRERIIELSKSFRSIPGVIDVRVGRALASDRPIVDDSFDVGIYLSFANEEDLNSYLTHPEHVQAVSETIKVLVNKIVVYDILE